MLMLGGWWIIAGIVAIANSDFYVVTQEWVFEFSTTSWGWTHLILGVVVLLAGLGVFTGAVWARTVGVILAGISGLVRLAALLPGVGDPLRHSLGVYHLGTHCPRPRHHHGIRHRSVALQAIHNDEYFALRRARTPHIARFRKVPPTGDRVRFHVSRASLS